MATVTTPPITQSSFQCAKVEIIPSLIPSVRRAHIDSTHFVICDTNFYLLEIHLYFEICILHKYNLRNSDVTVPTKIAGSKITSYLVTFIITILVPVQEP